MPTTRKIVILEDDRSTCALMATVLIKAGYHVFQAHEGRYAIELVVKERPSLLVSDVLVPDINGSEVVKQLLESSFGPELNTLFLTSLLDKGDNSATEKRLTVEGREYPALAKPLNPEKFLEMVERIAGGPVIEDPIPVVAEVEDAVDVQAEAAEDAIESADGESAEESGEETADAAEEEKAAQPDAS